MFWLKLLVLLVSLSIFIEDITRLSVHWWLFPVLCGSLILIGLHFNGDYHWMMVQAFANMAFIAIVFGLLSVVYSIKQRRFVNITKDLLGLGDFAFLISIALYLPFINYFLFFIGSTICVLLLWLPFKVLLKKVYVPLAGLQALLFGGLFLAEWIVPSISLANDQWFINVLVRW